MAIPPLLGWSRLLGGAASMSYRAMAWSFFSRAAASRSRSACRFECMGRLLFPFGRFSREAGRRALRPRSYSARPATAPRRAGARSFSAASQRISALRTRSNASYRCPPSTVAPARRFVALLARRGRAHSRPGRWRPQARHADVRAEHAGRDIPRAVPVTHSPSGPYTLIWKARAPPFATRALLVRDAGALAAQYRGPPITRAREAQVSAAGRPTPALQRPRGSAHRRTVISADGLHRLKLLSPVVPLRA
jgi:hypothetical protein